MAAKNTGPAWGWHGFPPSRERRCGSASDAACTTEQSHCLGFCPCCRAGGCRELKGRASLRWRGQVVGHVRNTKRTDGRRLYSRLGPSAVVFLFLAGRSAPAGYCTAFASCCGLSSSISSTVSLTSGASERIGPLRTGSFPPGFERGGRRQSAGASARWWTGIESSSCSSSSAVSLTESSGRMPELDDDVDWAAYENEMLDIVPPDEHKLPAALKVSALETSKAPHLRREQAARFSTELHPIQVQAGGNQCSNGECYDGRERKHTILGPSMETTRRPCRAGSDLSLAFRQKMCAAASSQHFFNFSHAVIVLPVPNPRILRIGP